MMMFNVPARRALVRPPSSPLRSPLCHQKGGKNVVSSFLSNVSRILNTTMLFFSLRGIMGFGRFLVIMWENDACNNLGSMKHRDKDERVGHGFPS